MRIKIIGAGPSGSISAVSALHKSHRVEIYEEHKSAGYPQHCSGLISKGGLDTLSDFVDYTPFIINRISGAVFDFAGEKFEIKRKQPTAFVIDRGQFDSVLAQKAEEEGAKIFYEKRVLPETGKADAIIGADGVLSTTAHHFSFPKIQKFAFTLKAFAKIKIAEPHKVFLFYDNKNIPGFFGWLIPHNEYAAEIGMGTTHQPSMLSGFQYLVKKTGAKLCENPKGKIIPLEPREKISGVFHNTNILLVGDAAGQVKSSSGGGIVFGASGAQLAGSLVHSPMEYESAWKQKDKNDLHIHVLLRKFLAIQPNLLLRLMAIVSNGLALNHFLSFYGNMDRPTKILKFIPYDNPKVASQNF